MQNSRLPIEVCEVVIDSIRETRPWWDRRPNRWHCWDFCACALVCSGWLTRARIQMFHTVAFTSRSQLELFIHVIIQNPFYASLVRELVLLPLTDEEYIPFGHAALVSRLHRLRSIVYTYVENVSVKTIAWPYPSRYLLLAGQYSLTDLSINFPFGSLPPAVWVEFIRLIWSLRGLQSLHLQLEAIPHLTPQELFRLETNRRPWTCGQLRTFVIQVRGRNVILVTVVPDHSEHLSR